MVVSVGGTASTLMSQEVTLRQWLEKASGSKAGSCDSEANGIRAGTMAACAGGSSLFSKAKGQLCVGGGSGIH